MTIETVKQILHPFRRILENMGAVPERWDVIPWDSDEWERLNAEGIEVEQWEVITAPETGHLEWHGHIVVLYIKEVYGDPRSYRFHLTECSTLKGMKTRGLGYRYVVTRQRDPFFKIRIQNEYGYWRDARTILLVCKNCLRNINYMNYNIQSNKIKNEIQKNFRIHEYLQWMEKKVGL